MKAATILIATAIAVVFGASTARAEDLKMPTKFPEKGQFKKEQLNEQEFSFEWKRDAGSGGENHGKDWDVDNGKVIVGWEIHTISERNTKGSRDLHLNYEERGPLRLPTGVHNGHRLTPDKLPTQKGTAYKGTIKVYTVAEEDWYKALKN